MNDPQKPARVLELSIDIDASPEEVWKALTEAPGLQNWFAEKMSTQGTGVGSGVTISFSPEMTWTTTVTAWEPGRHVGWGDEGMMGPGTRLLVDYYITTESGKTRVRFVQSGFGDAAWDDFFSGTKTGWTYFLYNLRLYLERHLGKVRRMISSRFEVGLPRDVAWKKVISSAGGLVMATGGTLHAGDWVQVKLHDPATLRAVVEVIVEGHALAMRIPDLADSVIFIELEGGQDTFNIGVYLSVYDGDRAREIEAPARRALDRVKQALK